METISYSTACRSNLEISSRFPVVGYCVPAGVDIPGLHRPDSVTDAMPMQFRLDPQRIYPFSQPACALVKCRTYHVSHAGRRNHAG